MYPVTLRLIPKFCTERVHGVNLDRDVLKDDWSSRYDEIPI